MKEATKTKEEEDKMTFETGKEEEEMPATKKITTTKTEYHHGFFCLLLFMGTTMVANFVVGVMAVLSYTSLSKDKFVDFYNEVRVTVKTTTAYHQGFFCVLLFIGTTFVANFVVGVMTVLSYTSLSMDKLINFYNEARVMMRTTSMTTIADGQATTTTVAPHSKSGITSPLANIWVGLYRSVPSVHLPLTTFGISFTVYSAAFLYLIRLGLKMLMLSQVVGWQQGGEEGEHYDETKSSTWELERFLEHAVAVVHSMTLVPGVFVALQSLPSITLTADMSCFPSQDHHDLIEALLQFCTGYMIYDVVTAESNALFVAHHLISVAYITQCRLLKAGYTSALLCMFVGEITNPLQNGYFSLQHLTTNACCDGPFWQQMLKGFEAAYAFSFFAVRAMFAPFFLLYVTHALLAGESATRNKIHLGNRMLWLVLLWSMVAGSYGHIVQSWELIQLTLGEWKWRAEATMMCLLGEAQACFEK